MQGKQDNPAQARAAGGRWYSRAGRRQHRRETLPAPRRGAGKRTKRWFLGITSSSSSSGCIFPSSKGGPEHKARARISQKKRMSLIFFLIFFLIFI